jgi:pimeloyl-ACP methyl ester carboxylesterase
MKVPVATVLLFLTGPYGDESFAQWNSLLNRTPARACPYGALIAAAFWLLLGIVACRRFTRANGASPGPFDQLSQGFDAVKKRLDSVASQLVRLLLDATREPPSLLRLLYRDYRAAGFRGMRDLARAAIHDRPEDKLPSIDAPTLLVRGARDPLVPKRWANQIASLLPHPKLVEIANGTHAVQYQSPVAVAGALQEFLTESTGSLAPMT